MERIVIVGYKPLPGKASELRDLLHSHVEILRQEKLATSREPIIMESANGSFLEVFGWTSKEAIEAAHSNPAVQKMWEAFLKVCEYIPVSEIAESHDLFSEFSAFDPV